LKAYLNLFIIQKEFPSRRSNSNIERVGKKKARYEVTY